MKFFKWTVEIAVSETWVGDGFDLTDEAMHDIMTRTLGFATSTEIRCRVTKRPDRHLVNKVQGTPSNAARTDWPSTKFDEAKCYLVTKVDDKDGKANYGRAYVYGIEIGRGAEGTNGVDLLLGLEPDEYIVEPGDIVTIDTTENAPRSTVRCVHFGEQKYPEYDTRARNVTRATLGVIKEG